MSGTRSKEEFLGIMKAKLDYEIRQNEMYNNSPRAEELRVILQNISNLIMASDTAPLGWIAIMGGLVDTMRKEYHGQKSW